MITYHQMDAQCLREYGTIPMIYRAEEILEVVKEGKGLGGISYAFRPEPVKPFAVDFDEGEPPSVWADRFDLDNWAFFLAREGDRPVGGAAVAARTPAVRMLDGREDMALLWDLRVREEHKRRGIGQELLDLAKNWCRAQGYRLLKIECQNTNPAACRFYEKQGAELEVVNRHFYGTGEWLLFWYLSL